MFSDYVQLKYFKEADEFWLRRSFGRVRSRNLPLRTCWELCISGWVWTVGAVI